MTNVMTQSLRRILCVVMLCGLLAGSSEARAQDIPVRPDPSTPVVGALPAGTAPYSLTPASPNPFTRQTAFRLGVAAAQHVRVDVYNMLGQRIARLYSDRLPAGAVRTLTFEAGGLPSGIYLIRVQGEDFVASRQVTLLR